MSEPLIVGIRHHSPACARLVKSLIESQRPRYVLIEGPADFNDRVSIARCGCVNLTADRMKRSFTLTCIAGKRFAISCAIYIAALIYPAFLFLRR